MSRKFKKSSKDLCTHLNSASILCGSVGVYLSNLHSGCYIYAFLDVWIRAVLTHVLDLADLNNMKGSIMVRDLHLY